MKVNFFEVIAGILQYHYSEEIFNMKHLKTPSLLIAATALISGNSPAFAQHNDLSERYTCRAVQADRVRLEKIKILEENERASIKNGQTMLRLSTPNAKLNMEVAGKKRDSERFILKLQQTERALRETLSASFARRCKGGSNSRSSSDKLGYN